MHALSVPGLRTRSMRNSCVLRSRSACGAVTALGAQRVQPWLRVYQKTCSSASTTAIECHLFHATCQLACDAFERARSHWCGARPCLLGSAGPAAHTATIYSVGASPPPANTMQPAATQRRAPTLLLSLPRDALVRVLAAVDVQTQMQAARACSCLRAAALEAVHSVVTPHKRGPARTCLRPPYEYAPLVAFLAQHGRHVTSVVLHSRHWTDNSMAVLRELPAGCRSQLRQLDITDANVQLASGGGGGGGGAAAAGVLQGATGLTRLVLRNVVPHQCSGGAVAAATAQLTGLRHLCVQLAPDPLPWVLPCSFVSVLVHLTHLELATRATHSDTWLQHLNCLVELQTLALECPKAEQFAVAGLSALQRLRRLSMTCGPDGSGNTVAPPQLSALRELTALTLERMTLDAECLASMVQLRELALELCSVEDEARFLDALSRLQQLRVLELVDVPLFHDEYGAQACPLPAYAALTASSHLTRLKVLDSALPEGALSHMFRGQRGLRQLQHLTLEGIEHEVSEMDLEWIAKSCPGLRQLRFLGGDDLPRALWHLDYLDGLTTLQVSVCDPRFKPAAMASALAQLTGLRNLSLSCSMREQPCGWLALAELRALTHLHMDVDDCVTTLSDTAPAGAPPDVARRHLARVLQEAAAAGDVLPDDMLLKVARRARAECEAGDVAGAKFALTADVRAWLDRQFRLHAQSVRAQAQKLLEVQELLAGMQ